jgi:hypothetical protein
MCLISSLSVIEASVSFGCRDKYVHPAVYPNHFSSFPPGSESLIFLVPGERIELPTNGLQNRCSTAELTRLKLKFQ